METSEIVVYRLITFLTCFALGVLMCAVWINKGS